MINGRRVLRDARMSGDTIQRYHRDPLIGLPVTITNKHELKGYHGLVKAICATGHLQIEMEATLRVIRVPRNLVCLRYSITYLVQKLITNEMMQGLLCSVKSECSA